MKGTIKIMLAENQFGEQIMNIEGKVEDLDKKGVFAILDHVMHSLECTDAEKKEFALRLLLGKFKHKTLKKVDAETDSAEHRAYKRMLEGMIE